MDCDWVFEGWYYRLEANLLGPVTTDQMKQLVSSGVLPPGTKVWKRWRKGAQATMFPTIAKTAFDTQIVLSSPAVASATAQPQS